MACEYSPQRVFASRVLRAILGDEMPDEALVDAAIRVFVAEGDAASVLAILGWYRRGWTMALDGWEAALLPRGGSYDGDEHDEGAS